MKKYFTPILNRTGELHAQPNGQALRADGWFDRDCAYLGPFLLGAIDAPAFIPRGGIRVIDGAQCIVGVAGERREEFSL